MVSRIPMARAYLLRDRLNTTDETEAARCYAAALRANLDLHGSEINSTSLNYDDTNED